MRKIIFIITLNLQIAYSQSNFSNGYSDGYKNGYCQNQGIGCMSPLPPIAPIPNIGENLNSYQDGYNRGFASGLNSQKSSNSNSDRQRYQTSEAEYVEDKMRQTNINDAVAVSIMLYDFKDEIVKLGDTNPERQIQLCKAGLSINPKDIEFLALIGRIYARHYNDDTNALYYLEKARRYDTNKETGVENLINAIKNGRIERVKSNRESVIATPMNSLSTDIEGNLKLAYSSFSAKDYPNAIKYFSLVYKENKDPKILYYRALSKDQVDDIYGALADYDKLIEIAESGKEVLNLGTIYNNKAYKLTKLKRFNEALPFVNKALQYNKNLGYIWDTRGEINYNLKLYKECISDMEKSITLQPIANSYYYRGLSKVMMMQIQNACEDFSKAGELGKAEAYQAINQYCK